MMDFDIDPNIKMRLMEERDAPAMFAASERNREHLRPWMPWIEVTNCVEDTLTFVKSALVERERGNGYQYVIMEGENVIGTLGHHHYNARDHEIYIGYWLDAEYQGRGIMTRACRALIDLTFEHMPIHRMVIQANVENLASRKVAERLGFTFEGVAREAELVNGAYRDLAIYSLLDREWNKSPQQVK